MNMLVASLVCVGLLIVSLAHFMWGFRRPWPVRDRKILAKTVIGKPGVEAMPPALQSLGIAIGSLAAAVLALALADHDAGGGLMSAIGALVGLVFLARGVAGYMPAFRAARPEEPFRTNNVRVYSPLCLLIGVGFLLLCLMRSL